MLKELAPLQAISAICSLYETGQKQLKGGF